MAAHSKVSFFTPVDSSVSPYKLYKIVDYLFWFGGRVAVQVNPDRIENGSHPCRPDDNMKTTWVATTLKIVAMVATLGILPLLALITKLIMRCCTKFHYRAEPIRDALPPNRLQRAAPASADIDHPAEAVMNRHIDAMNRADPARADMDDPAEAVMNRHIDAMNRPAPSVGLPRRPPPSRMGAEMPPSRVLADRRAAQFADFGPPRADVAPRIPPADRRAAQFDEFGPPRADVVGGAVPAAAGPNIAELIRLQEEAIKRDPSLANLANLADGKQPEVVEIPEYPSAEAIGRVLPRRVSPEEAALPKEMLALIAASGVAEARIKFRREIEELEKSGKSASEKKKILNAFDDKIDVLNKLSRKQIYAHYAKLHNQLFPENQLDEDTIAGFYGFHTKESLPNIFGRDLVSGMQEAFAALVFQDLKRILGERERIRSIIQLDLDRRRQPSNESLDAIKLIEDCCLKSLAVLDRNGLIRWYTEQHNKKYPQHPLDASNLLNHYDRYVHGKSLSERFESDFVIALHEAFEDAAEKAHSAQIHKEREDQDLEHAIALSQAQVPSGPQIPVEEVSAEPKVQDAAPAAQPEPAAAAPQLAAPVEATPAAQPEPAAAVPQLAAPIEATPAAQPEPAAAAPQLAAPVEEPAPASSGPSAKDVAADILAARKARAELAAAKK
jgi:hypothetical protein